MSTARTAALVCLALLCALAAPAFAMGHHHPAELPPPRGVVVLTRGPIHEAFAEPVVLSPATGLIVPVAPPAPINESAPEMGPATPGMVWIPGYWAWDQDSSRYIWISGSWRLAPPNCSWVPGYWNPVANGFQWVPGFWLPGNAQEISYLPCPPASEDAGPVGAAPSPDTLWIPGCQVWQGQGYAWRPGYWAAARADWLWNPAHYVWTPRGCVFIDGYWDYPLSKRGILFAPCDIDASVYGAPGFDYVPSVVLTSDIFEGAFFTCPGYDCYYFGDYYDAGYAARGIYPWYAFRDRHGWYDPIYEHRQWNHRADPTWDRQQRDLFSSRQANVNLRPAHTYAAEMDRLKNHPELTRRSPAISQHVNTPDVRTTAGSLARLSTESRNQNTAAAKQVQTYTQQRTQWEAPARTQPAVRPAERPAVEPAVRPAERPATQPAVRPAERPAVEPAVRPAERPATQPVVRPAERPATQPAVRPAERPAVEPAVRPAERPAAPTRTTPERIPIPTSPVRGPTSEHVSPSLPSRPEAPAARSVPTPAPTPSGPGGQPTGHR